LLSWRLEASLEQSRRGILVAGFKYPPGEGGKEHPSIDGAVVPQFWKNFKEGAKTHSVKLTYSCCPIDLETGTFDLIADPFEGETI
jgi:hypothetical protein